MKLDNYQEALDWLYTQLPMYQRQGTTAFKKSLDNILHLLAILDNPESKFDSIHIGGTNGKGTVANLFAASFISSDLKTGLYTSPHYLDFRERIRLDGRKVSKQYVLDWVNKIQTQNLEISPSFFEMTVAMAFEHFGQEEVDMAVVEVGLGGRLDSTNVLLPKLSVITNISFDHQAMLGNTLPAIAYEKAGIIKKGIPIVIGERHQETAAVFEEKAKAVGTDLFYAEDLVKLSDLGEVEILRKIELKVNDDNWPTEFKTSLVGPYQLENIRTFLASILIWNRYNKPKIHWPAIAKSLTQLAQITGYLGRWQILSRKPLVIADAAHNEAGLKTVLQKLDSYNRPIHFVLGFVNDKDLSKILPLFPQDTSYYFAKANIPRGLAANELKTKAAEFKLNGLAFASVEQALIAAKKKAKSDEIIFVGGSIFTIAEIIDLRF